MLGRIRTHKSFIITAADCKSRCKSNYHGHVRINYHHCFKLSFNNHLKSNFVNMQNKVYISRNNMSSVTDCWNWYQNKKHTFIYIEPFNEYGQRLVLIRWVVFKKKFKCKSLWMTMSNENKYICAAIKFSKPKKHKNIFGHIIENPVQSNSLLDLPQRVLI